MAMSQRDVIELCARAAHEVNRVYCATIGDDSQPPWDAAPEWQKSTVRNGVHGVLAGNNDPEQSHESWLARKKSDGWRYGPVKDPEKKEHPCFLPYKDLPDEQRVKDELFVNVVNAVFVAVARGVGE